MASSTAIAWMCLSLLVIYVLVTALFGNSFGLRRSPARGSVAPRGDRALGERSS